MSATNSTEKFMREALREAQKAAALDEVPVGAVAVFEGKIIARAHNKKEAKNCAVAHAEIELLEKVSKKLKNWYLEGVTVFVTLEPCAMCAGAMVNCRIDTLVFGACDPRFGACGSRLDVTRALNHKISVTGGVLEKECGEILTRFFQNKRKKDG